MYSARITYYGRPSQCAFGFASDLEAYQWLDAKAQELGRYRLMDPGYAFVVDYPQVEDDMEMARRLR